MQREREKKKSDSNDMCSKSTDLVKALRSFLVWNIIWYVDSRTTALKKKKSDQLKQETVYIGFGKQRKFA